MGLVEAPFIWCTAYHACRCRTLTEPTVVSNRGLAICTSRKSNDCHVSSLLAPVMTPGSLTDLKGRYLLATAGHVAEPKQQLISTSQDATKGSLRSMTLRNRALDLCDSSPWSGIRFVVSRSFGTGTVFPVPGSIFTAYARVCVGFSFT
jgi:hypothetical protein